MPCTISVRQQEPPKKERPATSRLHHRWRGKKKEPMVRKDSSNQLKRREMKCNLEKKKVYPEYPVDAHWMTFFCKLRSVSAKKPKNFVHVYGGYPIKHLCFASSTGVFEHIHVWVFLQVRGWCIWDCGALCWFRLFLFFLMYPRHPFPSPSALHRTIKTRGKRWKTDPRFALADSRIPSSRLAKATFFYEVFNLRGMWIFPA